LKPGEVATVLPPYAIDVVRYYLPAARRDRAVRFEGSSTNPALLILADQNLAPDVAESYRKDYPRTIARLRGVTVMRR